MHAKSVRVAASLVSVASLIGGTSAAHADPPKKCTKGYARELGDLQITMDATLATWEAVKSGAHGAINDMRAAIANPEQNVSIVALENGAIVTAQALRISLAKERERNLKDVKDFKVRYSRCFTGKQRDRFDSGVALVKAGLVEMASAKEHTLGVWEELQFADVAGAEENIRQTEVDVIAAEPTFDQGLRKLSKLT